MFVYFLQIVTFLNWWTEFHLVFNLAFQTRFPVLSNYAKWKKKCNKAIWLISRKLLRQRMRTTTSDGFCVPLILIVLFNTFLGEFAETFLQKQITIQMHLKSKQQAKTDSILQYSIYIFPYNFHISHFCKIMTYNYKRSLIICVSLFVHSLTQFSLLHI